MSDSKEEDQTICCHKGCTLNTKTKGSWKQIEKIYYANSKHRKLRIIILISDKTDFKMKDVIRDREEHF